MFSAIMVKSKAGRWFENSRCQDFDWRQSIRRLEDSLTAFVFDTLITTRGLTIAALLTKASGDVESAYGWLGEETFSIEYWPSYRYRGRRIEPDVVIVDSVQKRCLITETKWRGVQNTYQITGQMAAISARYPDYRITILLLGGYNAQNVRDELRRKVDPKVSISSVTWRGLQQALTLITKGNVIPSEKRALNHLQRGLKWYGIRLFEGIFFPNVVFPSEEPEFFKFFKFQKRKAKGQETCGFSNLYKLVLSKSNLSMWRLG